MADLEAAAAQLQSTFESMVNQASHPHAEYGNKCELLVNAGEILHHVYQSPSYVARACALSFDPKFGSYVLAFVNTLTKDEVVRVPTEEETSWWVNVRRDLPNARGWAAKEGFTRLVDLDKVISILEGFEC